eukprot:TRINITY_DN16316_c0_g1_i2.p1 TRINITY_DN16316_c0_g1~~TRINITY_DN16316_c0_g1_i2.p1  ORF type:complete len:453 (-),score=65.53 TRINITY_DN16316_c0_g1_i2:70-1428(-)
MQDSPARYELTPHGSFRTHTLRHPSGERHTVTMLPVHTDHVKFGEAVEDPPVPPVDNSMGWEAAAKLRRRRSTDRKIWKKMKCSKCGHDLGFGFERMAESSSENKPREFTGFFPYAVGPASAPELYPKLPKLQLMMKFLAFAQKGLAQLSQREIADVAVDGRALVLFEDPVSSFIEYLNHGTLLAAKQLLPPSQEAGQRALTVSFREGSPKEVLRADVQAAIEHGMPAVQQQPLLDLLNKAMLIILVKDVAPTELDNHPTATLMWHPGADAQDVNMTVIPSNLGQQNKAAGEGQFRSGKPILVESEIHAPVVSGEPREGCTELVGPSERWVNKVVVVDRGLCTFVTKLHFVQAAGAKAVIVRNTVSEPSLVMGSDPNHKDWEADLTIPGLMLTTEHGKLLHDNPGTLVSIVVTPPAEPTNPVTSTSAPETPDSSKGGQESAQEPRSAQLADP